MRLCESQSSKHSFVNSSDGFQSRERSGNIVDLNVDERRVGPFAVVAAAEDATEEDAAVGETGETGGMKPSAGPSICATRVDVDCEEGRVETADGGDAIEELDVEVDEPTYSGACSFRSARVAMTR